MGGAERQLCTLASTQILLGNEVEVINLKGNSVLKQNFEKNGVKVNKKICNKNIFYQIIWLLIYVNFNCEIVHAHLSRAELISAIIKIKPKLIISKHNSERLIPKSNQWFSQKIASFIFLRSNAVIVISNAVKNYLVSISEISLGNKLRRVYYASESERIFLKVKGIKSSKARRFGTICRLDPQKDLKTLLLAWQIHQREFTEDKLMILGDGVMKQELKEFAEELNLKNVKWSEPVLEVEEIYKNLDVFVLSTNYEGFGLVLLEAARFGLPIIASNNSSIPEVLGFNHPGLFATGDFVDLAKKFESFRKYSNQSRFSKNNQSILEKFSKTKMTKQVLDIYEYAKTI